MKRILVATDGSDGANRAIDYAAQLAKTFGAELLIANVIGGYGLPGDVFRRFTHQQHQWLEELLAAQSAEVLEKAKDRARGNGVGSVLLESRSGDVATTLVTIAEGNAAEIIVVGKRGSGQVAGLLLGSVSQRLVSLAPVPTLVVP